MHRSPNSRPLLVVAVLISAIVVMLSYYFLPELPLQARLLKLGLLVAFVIFGLTLFDKMIAKYGLMRWMGPILRVPYVGGRWEGWKLSDLSTTGEWQPFCILIEQGFFISAQAIGRRDRSTVNRSISMTNAQYFLDRQPATLVYTYLTAPLASHETDEPLHHGTFMLELDSSVWPSRLEGSYFHDMPRFGEVKGSGTRGSRGRVLLARSKQEGAANALFDEADLAEWGMPRPATRVIDSRASEEVLRA